MTNYPHFYNAAQYECRVLGMLPHHYFFMLTHCSCMMTHLLNQPFLLCSGLIPGC